MNSKFWLAIGIVAVAWLLVVGNIASGQTPAPGNDNIVLSGIIQCGNTNELPGVCPFNLHYIHLTAGQTYMLRMASSDYHASLTLENLEGKVLARDTDECDALNGMMVFRPAETGRYRLLARSMTPVEGFYTITIREMPMVVNVAETLEADDLVANDSHVRYYDVAMTAGRRYIIDLESNEFEPFVKLLNTEGAVVAFDDECGVMRNTRVVYEPTVTGTYRLVATSWDAGATGAFRLIVCED